MTDSCSATYTALDDLTHYRPTLKRKLDVVKSSEFVEMEPGLGEYVKVEDVRRLLSAVAVGPDATKMRSALEKIERWFGEFPATGKTWDDGSTMSYSACYGSNGERDYMRGIAKDALRVSPLATDETAWLVERHGSEWLSRIEPGVPLWTRDPNQACRFKDEEQAKGAIGKGRMQGFEKAKATEHIFCTRSTAATGGASCDRVGGESRCDRESESQSVSATAKPFPERLVGPAYAGSYVAGWNDFIDALQRIGPLKEGTASPDHIKGWNACHESFNRTDSRQHP